MQHKLKMHKNLKKESTTKRKTNWQNIRYKSAVVNNMRGILKAISFFRSLGGFIQNAP